MSEQPKKIDPIQGEILHEYDGIEEADNQLPLWWVACFLGTVAFGAAYWIGFEVLEARETPYQEYVAEAKALAAAREAQLNALPGVSNEVLEQLMSQPDTVASGAAVFNQQCTPCHGAKAEGKIGPNLTDDHWIHGGDPVAIHDTITSGVAAKGMPAWGPVLGPKATREVTAFVLSVRNTNAPGGKAPEGTATSAPHSAL